MVIMSRVTPDPKAYAGPAGQNPYAMKDKPDDRGMSIRGNDQLYYYDI